MNDLLLMSPIWICGLTGVLAMALDLMTDRSAHKGFLGYVVTGGLLTAGAMAAWQWRGSPHFEAPWFAGVLQVDAFALFFGGVVLFSAVAAALSSVDHLPEQGCDGGEHYALLAFSATGALVFLTAIDLVTLFLGLEVMSLALYVLAAQKRSSPFGAEAGLKYFILGGLAGGFLLFGAAFLYGATGHLDLPGIAAAFRAGDSMGGLLLPQLALVLLVVALGFKVAAVPFHQWTPDVYEGAPTPVTGFMAGAVKAVGFAVMARLLLTVFGLPAFDALPVALPPILLVLSMATMAVGNLLGIVQDNVKRILAYSSIAHAGYVLLGLYASRQAGGATLMSEGVAFYLLTYAAATVGAFGVLALLGARGEEDLSLDKVAGLGRRHPLLAALLLVCLLSLAGIPPTGGFLGKFNLFKQVLQADADSVPWVVIAVLNSLVALYYYLRIALYAYFREPAQEPVPAIRSVPGTLSAAVAALLALVLGVVPGRFLDAAEAASLSSLAGAPVRVVEVAAPLAPVEPVAPALSREPVRLGGSPKDLTRGILRRAPLPPREP